VGLILPFATKPVRELVDIAYVFATSAEDLERVGNFLKGSSKNGDLREFV
jgi:hypothetical protein